MANLVFPVRRRDHFMLRDAMFRTRARPSHGGIDLTPVKQNQSESCYAIERGKVIIADNTSGPVGDTSGRDIMILGRETGIRWWYGHLSSVSVTVGTEVKAGQFIGTTGTTGSNVKGSPSSSGVHLHLEAHYPRINVEIDPWPWIANAPDVDGSTMALAGSREKARAEYSNNPAPAPAPGGLPKGIFMALSDAEQTELLRRARTIESLLTVPNQPFGWLEAINNKVDAQGKTAEATLKAAEAARSALLDPVDGHRPIDVLRTHAIKTLNVLTSGTGPTLTAEAVATAVAAKMAQPALSDEDLRRIAVAVADEDHRRSAN